MTNLNQNIENVNKEDETGLLVYTFLLHVSLLLLIRVGENDKFQWGPQF